MSPSHTVYRGGGYRAADSLELEGLSPEEDVVHDLAAGAGVEDLVEGYLAVVPLLGLEGPGLKDPHRELGVDPTHVVLVGTLAVGEAGREGEREGEREGGGRKVYCWVTDQGVHQG